MIVSRNCLFLVVCVIVLCFGQDIDPDTFDFDNFDAYLTTESFEYTTLDPLSFFPTEEDETEIPVTESPVADSVGLLADGNNGTSVPPRSKEDGTLRQPEDSVLQSSSIDHTENVSTTRAPEITETAETLTTTQGSKDDPHKVIDQLAETTTSKSKSTIERVETTTKETSTTTFTEIIPVVTEMYPTDQPGTVLKEGIESTTSTQDSTTTPTLEKEVTQSLSTTQNTAEVESEQSDTTSQMPETTTIKTEMTTTASSDSKIQNDNTMTTTDEAPKTKSTDDETTTESVPLPMHTSPAPELSTKLSNTRSTTEKNEAVSEPKVEGTTKEPRAPEVSTSYPSEEPKETTKSVNEVVNPTSESASTKPVTVSKLKKDETQTIAPISTTTPKTTTSKSLQEDGTTPKADPRLKISIEDSLESIELTTRSYDSKQSRESNEDTSKEVDEMPDLKSPIPIDDSMEPVELTTKPSNENVIPTWKPQHMIPITKPTTSSVTTTARVDEELEEFTYPTFIDDSDEIYEAESEEVSKEQTVNKFRPTPTTMNPFFKQVDELPGSAFDPSLKKPIEEPMEPEDEKRPVFKFNPLLRRPIEEPVLKPAAAPPLQVRIRDPSCGCIRTVASNQIPQGTFNVQVRHDPVKPAHHHPQENVQTYVLRGSQGNNFGASNNAWKISIDNNGDYFNSIRIPTNIFEVLPNSRKSPAPQLETPPRKTSNSLPSRNPNRIYIQGGVSGEVPAAQIPVKTVYRYNSGSGPPTVIRVAEQEQPRQFYYQHTPSNVNQRVLIPSAERRMEIPQRWLVGSSPEGSYRQESNQFGYISQSGGDRCYYKVKEGPLLMDGDSFYGRLIVSQNVCKRCYYCCINSEYEQCSRTTLSECASRNLIQSNRLIPNYTPPLERNLQHPNNGCKVTKTWPNGPSDLPRFKIVCT